MLRAVAVHQSVLDRVVYMVYPGGQSGVHGSGTYPGVLGGYIGGIRTDGNDKNVTKRRD